MQIQGAACPHRHADGECQVQGAEAASGFTAGPARGGREPSPQPARRQAAERLGLGVRRPKVARLPEVSLQTPLLAPKTMPSWQGASGDTWQLELSLPPTPSPTWGGDCSGPQGGEVTAPPWWDMTSCLR